MKYCIFALSAFAILSTQSASATEVGISRNFGLGVQVGSPTALVGKVFLGRGNAFDFGLGFGGWNRRCRDVHGHWYDCNNREGYLSLHADYLYEESFINQPFRLNGHVGIGGRFINHSDWDNDASLLLARFPLGLDFTFRRPSWLEAYIEIAPGILLIPGLDLWVDIGLGVRAYF